MDRSNTDRPVILAYSRRIASELQEWLLAHEIPGTVLAASTLEEARPSIDRGRDSVRRKLPPGVDC